MLLFLLNLLADILLQSFLLLVLKSSFRVIVVYVISALLSIFYLV